MSVGALIVAYEAPANLLAALLESLPPTAVDEVLVVDNHSTRQDGLEAAREQGATILPMGRNAGFPAAVNAGFAALARHDWVLVLNFDIHLLPGAVEALVAAGESHPKVAAVAPKILLYDHPGHLDAVGTQVHPGFLASNRGIGQPDLGQFDAVEPVAGVCFGAALIRRSAWEEVGGMWEPYFLYYEDVDWCWRARLGGWLILSAPEAGAVHRHSWLLRTKPTAAKYIWVQSNLLLAIARLLEPGRALRETVRRLRQLRLRARAEPSLARASRSLVWRWLGLLPKALASRRSTQAGRQVSDALLFAFAEGHRGCFDDAGYRPLAGPEPEAVALAWRYTLGWEEGDRERALALAGKP